jgi:hypothetical protein
MWINTCVTVGENFLPFGADITVLLVGKNMDRQTRETIFITPSPRFQPGRSHRGIGEMNTMLRMPQRLLSRGMYY